MFQRIHFFQNTFPFVTMHLFLVCFDVIMRFSTQGRDFFSQDQFGGHFGASKVIVTGRGWWKSGTEMTVVGLGEATITYIIGLPIAPWVG